MRSSRRQPRYRARFLTHTRNLRPRLLELSGQLELPLDKEPHFHSAWATLFRGLCLKSASEIDATPDAQERAGSLAIVTCSHRGLRMRGTRVIHSG